MKKFLALCLAVVMCASLAACGKNSDSSSTPKEKAKVSLKVWGGEKDQALLKTLTDKFKAANPDKEYTITIAVVGEPDAKKTYLEDPAAAADVFSMPNDQLYDLVKAGALYEVTKNKDAIVSANSKGSIEAATYNGKLYAYPATADNGYFMYYDKSVFTEDDVKSFEKMLDVAGSKGKNVFMDVSNGWFIASFFLGAGGKLELTADGKQTCDFNNDTGVKVGESIKNITANKAFLTGDDAVITANIGTKIAACVTGTWNAAAIKEKLGANYAATKLPTFKVGDKDTQMSSFAGYKQYGVNSQTKAPVDAMALAEFLTNEQSQLERFTTLGYGPSNTKAASNDAVKADIALSALIAQSAYATLQNSVSGNYWTPAEAFGTAMETKDYSKSIKDQLDAMVAQIVK